MSGALMREEYCSGNQYVRSIRRRRPGHWERELSGEHRPLEFAQTIRRPARGDSPAGRPLIVKR